MDRIYASMPIERKKCHTYTARTDFVCKFSHKITTGFLVFGVTESQASKPSKEIFGLNTERLFVFPLSKEHKE
jgi:hypothetical protein